MQVKTEKYERHPACFSVSTTPVKSVSPLGRLRQQVPASESMQSSGGDKDQPVRSHQRATQGIDALVPGCVPWMFLETRATKTWVTQRRHQGECTELGLDVEM